MNQLIETVFNDELTKAGLDELRAKYPANVVMDMSDDANFKKARKIRTERNKLVEAIDRKRKDFTAEVKEKGDSLIVEVDKVYGPIITDFELEDKRKKDEAKRLKDELESLLTEERKRISTINGMVSGCRGADSEYISDTIESIDLIETDVFHKDVIHEAIEVKKLALNELTQMLADTISREKVAAERAELEKMRADMEAQQAKLKAEAEQLAKPQVDTSQDEELAHAENDRLERIKGEGAYESKLAAQRMESFESRRPSAVSTPITLTDYQQGYIDGLAAFAHWKDGKQLVGTAGVTLQQAQQQFLNKVAA